MPMNTPNAQPTSPRTPEPSPFGASDGARWADAGPPVRARDLGALMASVEDLPGVGSASAKRLAGLGIEYVDDLIAHLPVRYLRYEEARPLGRVQTGEEATVRVTVGRISIRPTRQRRLRIVEATISDATGAAIAIWFNQEYLVRTIQPGGELLLRGVLEPGRPPKFKVKTHEILGEGGPSTGLHTQGLVPVYPATEAVPARRIRELLDAVRPATAEAVEALPTWIRRRLGLPHAGDAYMAMHVPRTTRDPRQGRRRLVLEELIVMQLGLGALRRQEALGRPAPKLDGDGEVRRAVRERLPFTLTDEQERVADEIARDLRRDRPMRRLLQGEVGSGKTVVAALAMCQAVEAGRQAALLVPTETLAEQHLRTLDELLAPTGLSPVLMTGKVSKAERERRRLALRTGTASIAVGTQALLSEADAFHRLGLVVVDEQHRFGVEQRQLLADRASDAGDDLAAQVARVPPVGFLRGCACLRNRPRIHEWADDVGLPTVPEFCAHPVVGAFALGLAHPERLNRRPSRRTATNRGDLQVAVGGDCEGARDRRGGHVQQVRRQIVAGVAGPVGKQLTLLHTEPVLLVHHDQSEPMEGVGFRQQRLRADRDTRRAGA